MSDYLIAALVVGAVIWLARSLRSDDDHVSRSTVHHWMDREQRERSEQNHKRWDWNRRIEW